MKLELVKVVRETKREMNQILLPRIDCIKRLLDGGGVHGRICDEDNMSFVDIHRPSGRYVIYP